MSDHPDHVPGPGPGNDTDRLGELLDASFGDGPPPPAASARLRPARRGLRRRRWTTGGATAVVTAVAVTAFALAQGGTSTRAVEPAAPVGPAGPAKPAPPEATDATSNPSAAPTSADPTTPPRPTDSDVELAADGTVLRAVGVRITRRVPDPLSSTLPERSLGVAYTKGGEGFYALLEYTPDGGFVSWDPADKGGRTLEEWLAQMVALHQMSDDDTGSGTSGPPGVAPGDPVLVRLGPDETLRPEKGATILDQTADVDLPGFAGPDEVSAAAMVRLDGRRWFVLAREIDGLPDFVVTPGRVATTLAGFLDHAEAQYASGEGLR